MLNPYFLDETVLIFVHKWREIFQNSTMDYYLDCPVPIFDSIRKKPVGIIGPVPNLRVPVKQR